MEFPQQHLCTNPIASSHMWCSQPRLWKESEEVALGQVEPGQCGAAFASPSGIPGSERVKEEKECRAAPRRREGRQKECKGGWRGKAEGMSRLATGNRSNRSS